MRPVRNISEKEEGHRYVKIAGLANAITSKRNPVEPEPIGTIVLMAFRITGYTPDCDGSLMAKLDHIDKDGNESGWSPDSIGLYPDSDLVVTPAELKALFKQGRS